MDLALEEGSNLEVETPVDRIIYLSKEIQIAFLFIEIKAIVQLFNTSVNII